MTKFEDSKFLVTVQRKDCHKRIVGKESDCPLGGYLRRIYGNNNNCVATNPDISFPAVFTMAVIGGTNQDCQQLKYLKEKDIYTVAAERKAGNPDEAKFCNPTRQTNVRVGISRQRTLQDRRGIGAPPSCNPDARVRDSSSDVSPLALVEWSLS